MPGRDKGESLMEDVYKARVLLIPKLGIWKISTKCDEINISIPLIHILWLTVYPNIIIDNEICKCIKYVLFINFELYSEM